MKIAFWGDSLTEGIPGIPYIPILQEKFPEHEMINLGIGGDSVVSLLRRLRKMKTHQQFDLAFVWIGTNDVFPKVSWTFPIIRFFRGQPHSKNAREFTHSYRQILEIVSQQTPRVMAISPWVIGEDPHNRFNRKMGELSSIAQEITREFENIDFLDVRQSAFNALASRELSNFYATSLLQIFLDVVQIKDAAQVDKVAVERGLHFTLDGVHLNSAGAHLIADCCAQSIQRELRSVSP